MELRSAFIQCLGILKESIVAQAVKNQLDQLRSLLQRDTPDAVIKQFVQSMKQTTHIRTMSSNAAPLKLAMSSGKPATFGFGKLPSPAISPNLMARTVKLTTGLSEKEETSTFEVIKVETTAQPEKQISLFREIPAKEYRDSSESQQVNSNSKNSTSSTLANQSFAQSKRLELNISQNKLLNKQERIGKADQEDRQKYSKPSETEDRLEQILLANKVERSPKMRINQAASGSDELRRNSIKKKSVLNLEQEPETQLSKHGFVNALLNDINRAMKQFELDSFKVQAMYNCTDEILTTLVDKRNTEVESPQFSNRKQKNVTFYTIKALFNGLNAKMSDEDLYNIQKNFLMKKLIVKAKADKQDQFDSNLKQHLFIV